MSKTNRPREETLAKYREVERLRKTEGISQLAALKRVQMASGSFYAAKMWLEKNPDEPVISVAHLPTVEPRILIRKTKNIFDQRTMVVVVNSPAAAVEFIKGFS